MDEIEYNCCPICHGPIQGDRQSLESCNHLYCRSCLSSYFEYQVSNRGIPACPTCRADVSSQLLKELLCLDSFEKLKKIKYERQCLNMATIECPHCHHDGNPNNNDSVSSCTECGGRLPQNDSLSMALIFSITKPCSSCGMALEKIDGCDYVVCSWCKTSLCWSCETHERLYHCRGAWTFECHGCSGSYIDEQMQEEIQDICDNRRWNNIEPLESAMVDLEKMLDTVVRRERSIQENLYLAIERRNKPDSIDEAMCDLECLLSTLPG